MAAYLPMATEGGLQNIQHHIKTIKLIKEESYNKLI